MNFSSHIRWVNLLGLGTREALLSLDKAVDVSSLGLSEGFVHKHTLNSQYALALEAFKAGKSSNSDYLICLNHHAEILRKIRMLVFIKKVAIRNLLDMSEYGLSKGSLLILFSGFRGLIEQVAHFESAFSLLREEPSSNEFQDILRFSLDRDTHLARHVYATRTNWDGVTSEKVEELLNKNQLKYRSIDGLENLYAQGCLGPVDLLSKRVIGARGAYEFLCEFVHPNIGTLLSTVRVGEVIKDRQDVQWVVKCLSNEIPEATFASCQCLFDHVFLKVAKCAEYFISLVGESDSHYEKFARYVQIIIRHRFATDQFSVDPYSLCPCGSDKKIKFCCGTGETTGTH